ADNFGILLWNAIPEYRAPGRSCDARGIEEIFQSDWNTVERSAPSLLPNLGLGGLRFVHRDVRSYGYVCMKCRVQSGDALQHHAGHFDWRYLSCANQLAQPGNREERPIVFFCAVLHIAPAADSTATPARTDTQLRTPHR